VAILEYPQVINFSGSQLLCGDFDSTRAVEWTAEITLRDKSDEEGDPLTVGGVKFITASLTDETDDMLDAYSPETEIFSELFDGEFLAAEVEDQFEGVPSGLIILKSAYLLPAVRGRNLGAWAVAEVIHHMGFAALSFIAGYPCPSGGGDLAPKERKQACASLARHWEKVGLRPITAAPHLMGQLGDHLDLDKSRSELEFIKDIEVEISAADLAAIKDGTDKSARPAVCCVDY